MTNKIIGILNGNVNSFIRIIFIAVLIGLGAFLFNFATNAHTVFATKKEVQTIQIRVDKSLNRIESKVDDINKFLRKQ